MRPRGSVAGCGTRRAFPWSMPSPPLPPGTRSGSPSFSSPRSTRAGGSGARDDLFGQSYLVSRIRASRRDAARAYLPERTGARALSPPEWHGAIKGSLVQESAQNRYEPAAGILRRSASAPGHVLIGPDQKRTVRIDPGRR